MRPQKIASPDATPFDSPSNATDLNIVLYKYIRLHYTVIVKYIYNSLLRDSGIFSLTSFVVLIIIP